MIQVATMLSVLFEICNSNEAVGFELSAFRDRNHNRAFICCIITGWLPIPLHFISLVVAANRQQPTASSQHHSSQRSSIRQQISTLLRYGRARREMGI
jgi:hypothetical protein